MKQDNNNNNFKDVLVIKGEVLLGLKIDSKTNWWFIQGINLIEWGEFVNDIRI